MVNKSSVVAEMGDCSHNRHGPRRRGTAVPISRRAGTPSNAMWTGPRSTTVPSGVFIHPVVWPQRTLDKNWGLCPFKGGEAGSRLTQSRLAEAYLNTKWHLDASSRLATITRRPASADRTARAANFRHIDILVLNRFFSNCRYVP